MASLNLYILTFNCGRAHVDVDSFASQLFTGLSTPKLPDILVLSLQELAPVAHSFVGSFLLAPYFGRFHHAVQKATRKLSGVDDDPYALVAARNIGMTGIMVFAKDLAAIQDLETGGVGVGVADMGNKGAVGARFTYRKGDSHTKLTFVAAHLAAMEDAVPRRNEDWKNIPSPTDYSDSFPQPDHASLAPLFERDQLNRERTAGRTCHGLVEAQVTFPPTYKYETKGPFLTPDAELSRWPWAVHRWPSWCDRILYLDIPAWMKSQSPDAAITTHKYTALPLFPSSDHRPVALDVSLPLIPIPEPEENETDDPRASPPFNVDINWKSKRDRARVLELVSGSLLYLATTVEGGGITLAMVAGAIGAYLAIKALLEYS